MFEKFGKFTTVEELNKTARGFLEEGDEESVFALAQENGLEKEDAEDYLDGIAEEFATATIAAMGRIGLWQTETAGNKDMAERMAMRVILSMLQTMCTDPELAAAVLSKDPNGIYQAMKEEAGKHISGIGQNRVAISCGTDQELRDIIRAYYLEPKKVRTKLGALYILDGGNGK